MEYAAIIGALVQAVPSVIDLVQNLQNSGAQKAQIDKALSELARAHGLIPQDAELELQPEEIDALSSESVRKARADALSNISGMADAKGMDDISKQQVYQARSEAEAQARSANADIESQLRRSGGYSQGIGALLKQGASADANNAMSSASMQAAADARRRALEAIMAQGSMANQIDEAEMARQQFNAKMRQASGMANVGTKMDLAKLRLDSANQMYGATTGANRQKQEVDDRTMKSVYGVGAQTGGVLKEVQDMSDKRDKKEQDDKRWQEYLDAVRKRGA